MKLIKVILFSFLLSTNAVAESFVTPPTVPMNLHIYNASGHAYVDTVSMACSGYRYSLMTTHVKYDAIFSLLLAAQMGNKKVQLKFEECNTIQQGLISGVYLVE